MTTLPGALWKAATDKPFEYAIGLRDGTVIEFEGAYLLDASGATLDVNTSFADEGLEVKLAAEMQGLLGEWIALRGVKTVLRGNGLALPENFTFDRGLDVRIADIMWATDAPHGS